MTSANAGSQEKGPSREATTAVGAEGAEAAATVVAGAPPDM